MSGSRALSLRWRLIGPLIGVWAVGLALLVTVLYINLLDRFRGLVEQRADTLVALTDPPLIGVGAWFISALRGARLIHWVQDIYPEVAIYVDGIYSPRSQGASVLMYDMERVEVLREGFDRAALVLAPQRLGVALALDARHVRQAKRAARRGRAGRRRSPEARLPRDRDQGDARDAQRPWRAAPAVRADQRARDGAADDRVGAQGADCGDLRIR